MFGYICFYGLKLFDLFNCKGYEVEDKYLVSCEQMDVFKKEYGVEIMFQVFINGWCVGGYDDLCKFFGMFVKDKNVVIYIFVIVLFVMVVVMVLVVSWVVFGQFWSIQVVEWFVVFVMCFLVLQKFKDVDGFVMMFFNYDLLVKCWVWYVYFYLFVEVIVGVLMVVGVGMWVLILLVLFIGIVGVVLVFKVVYVDCWEFKCVCVGGDSNVLLGFVFLIENLMMVVMVLWMWVKVVYFGMY